MTLVWLVRTGANVADGGTTVLSGALAATAVVLILRKTILAFFASHVGELSPRRTSALTVLGSIVGTRMDLQEVFELHAAGKTHVVYERRQLEDVNTAIREVEAGQVKARLVFDLQ